MSCGQGTTIKYLCRIKAFHNSTISLNFFPLDYTTETDTFVNHGVNGVFVLIDIWITAMPIRVLHFYVPMVFGVVYVIFSVIYDYSGATNALGSAYIYRVS